MAIAVLTKPTKPARTAAEPHRDTEPDADRVDDLRTSAAFLGLPRGQILSTVAHEIRGPLTSLLASAEILHEDFDILPSEQKREIVSSMHRGTLWLHALVENLLCEASLREGRLQMHRQPTEISEIVAEVEPIVTPLLDRNGQRLDLSFDDAPHIVNVDSRRIGQVLVNLLTNAAKYGRAGAPVELAVSRRAESVVVAVADHGSGLRPADLGRIFEPFVRANDATDLPGAGLGLAIVKSIVEAHGGWVGVSNRTGGGACFWFALPLAGASRTTKEN